MSDALSDSPYSLCDILFELNVFVSMISAPASIYYLWILAMTSGASRFSLSLFPSETGEYRWIMVPMAPSSISILSWKFVSITSVGIKNEENVSCPRHTFFGQKIIFNSFMRW